MINNPDWLKPKAKPYHHQILLDCVEKVIECMESIDTEEIDCDTCLIMQEILSDEIEDPEFLEPIVIIIVIYGILERRIWNISY